MKRHSMRLLSLVLCFLLLISIVPTTVLAAVDYNHGSSATADGYFNVVSKRDWSIAPGIDESEIILNDDYGSRREVAHVMVADLNNEYVKVTTSYHNMDTSVFETANMMQQATAAKERLGWNVVGAMNTCLSWYDNYPPEHIHEPLGFMMIDGEVVWDLTQKYGNLGFPTCVVINSDDRPAGVPKVEMKSITGTASLNGYEEQVIPCSSGFIVENGVSKYPTPNHVNDNNNAAPRSVVGITADGKVIIMEVDGRQSISTGMSMYECAQMMLDLGCVYACNCDGGGSSTFLSKRPGEELSVNNSPSDGTLRETTNGILFVSTAPADGQFTTAHISSEDKYFTPNSSVQFSAIGTDFSGNPAEIPAEAQWTLADPSYGTIDQNGLFTSTGKVGEVTAQITMPDSRVTDRSVVFSNNKNLTDVKIYYWNDENTNMVSWPGTAMTNFGVNEYNEPRFKFELPDDATKYIITGSNNGDFYQTGNLEFVSYTQAGVFLDDNYTAQYYDTSSIRTIAGEATVEIVIPEIAFTASTFSVKYGTTSDLTVVATTNGGMNEVVLKPGDFTITCDNNAIGTIDGTTFTAVDEADAPTDKDGTLTVTFTYDQNVTGTARVVICPEITEVLFDFEDGTQGWTIEEVGKEGVYASYGKNYTLTQATAENGEVHDGNASMKLFTNQLNAKVFDGSKDYYQLIMSPAECIILHDVQSYGVWLYVNDEMYAHQFQMKYFTDNNNDGVFETNNAYNPIPSLSVYQNIEESGWVYLNVPIGGKTIMIPGKDYKTRSDVIASIKNNAYYQNRAIHVMGYPHTSNAILQSGTVNGKYDVYFDNFTVDYAADVADRTAPTFGTITLLSKSGSNDKEMVYGRKTTDSEFKPLAVVNTDDNEINITARVSDAGDGINGSSAKAYVDGKQVNCTYSNGMISMSGVKVADGIHRIKFAITDRAGNQQVAIRLVNVNSGSDASTIVIEPKDATLDKLPCGSLYWMDLKATDISSIQSVSTTIDLNSSNHWELDHMVVADGFTADYTVDESTNSADITFTRTAPANRSRSNVLASLPIRVISFADDIQYPGKDEATYWTNTATHFWAQDVKVDIDRGEITYVDGYETDTIGTFSNGTFSVSTEMYKPQNNLASTEYFQTHGSLHVHSEEPVENKPATCTEDGYSGRTYCSVCDSIVDWGTVSAATGHSYDFIDGVLKCEDCGDLFNGVYEEDGKYYVNGLVAEGWQTIDSKQYYFIDGVKNTEDLILDNHLYTFDENGVYDENYSHTGPYYEEAAGKWRYFDHSDAYKGWVVYDNHSYFYNSDYYAATGVETMGGRDYKFEGVQGKCIGAWVEEAGGKRFYYGLKYYKYTWAEIEGETYYFDNNGHVLTGKVAISHNGAYIGAYEFDEDGKLVGNITGVFQDLRTGYYYYAEDGVLFNGGLLKWNDNYYFARSNHLLATSEWYVPADKTNNLKAAGTYVFAQDGKMVVEEGVIKGDDGIYRYYVDGVQQYGLGLIKVDDDYYYVRSNGTLATYEWYVGRNNLGINPGTYQFGEDGKMIVANGVIQGEDGIYRYYLNGVQQYGLGLIKVGDDYYYVRSNGKICTTDWYVGANDYGFPAGSYSFGEDGKMIILNGIVKVGDNLKYYVNGKAQSGLGLIEIDGDYYYVRSNGNLATSDWYVGENDYGIPKGSYRFGEDGKMVLLNGIIDVGGLKYYVDNEQQYGLGLIQYEGDFYYVRSNGNVITDSDYYIGRNDFGVSVGTHHFGPDGKMTDADI